jgi:hypothetical protein
LDQDVELQMEVKTGTGEKKRGTRKTPRVRPWALTK